MRTAAWFLALLSSLCCWTGSWAALHSPQSFAQYIDNDHDHEYHHHRNLLPSLLFGGCQRALSNCQDATGGITDLPTDAWVSQLESMDPSSTNPYVTELKEILVTANPPESEMEDFVNSIKNNRDAVTMVSLIKQVRGLDSLQPEQMIQSMTDILESAKGMAAARQAPNIIQVIEYALDFTFRLFVFLGSGPDTIDIVIFVLKEIARFVTTFIIKSARAAYMGADTACTAQVLQCNYHEMMLDVVPTLMQGVSAAAEKLSSSASDGGSA